MHPRREFDIAQTAIGLELVQDGVIFGIQLEHANYRPYKLY